MEKSAEKIVILDYQTGKVFIRSIPINMIEIAKVEELLNNKTETDIRIGY